MPIGMIQLSIAEDLRAMEELKKSQGWNIINPVVFTRDLTTAVSEVNAPPSNDEAFYSSCCRLLSSTTYLNGRAVETLPSVECLGLSEEWMRCLRNHTFLTDFLVPRIAGPVMTWDGRDWTEALVDQQVG